MDPFLYEALPSRVLFGKGTLQNLAGEIRRLDCSRAILLSTAGSRQRIERLQQNLGELAVAIFSEAEMHTPIEVTKRAMDAVQAVAADCIVSVGGGSTIGLGKALALRTDLPQIAIPTTYAGSEVTPILGETDAGEKVTQRTLKVLPETVIYDVDLTLTLPAHLSVTSGINAMAHAAEALYAKDRNPIISLFAEQGIAALGRALPVIASNLEDADARSDALYGAWACGTCLGAVGMALHHKLCHTLGGSFGLPHAETHTVILPHALAFNAKAAPEAMKRIAQSLGVADAPMGIFELAQRLGAPTSLRSLGMSEGDVERAALLAMSRSYWNPRPLEKESILGLLMRAFHGEAPRQEGR